MKDRDLIVSLIFNTLSKQAYVSEEKWSFFSTNPYWPYVYVLPIWHIKSFTLPRFWYHLLIEVEKESREKNHALDTLSVVAVRDKNLYFTCKNALGILILKDVGLHLILHRLNERIVTAAARRYRSRPVMMINCFKWKIFL